MFDICVAATLRGMLGERLVKISHMFSLSPLSPCLFHSVCADPLMSVSQASYGHHGSLAFDCLFSGPDSGGSLRDVKRKKIKPASWMFRGMLESTKRNYAVGCQRADVITFHLPDWAPRCIYLSSRTSLSGPKRPTAAAAKNPQQSGLANQGPKSQVPEAKGGKAGFVFLLPVSLSLSPILHNATGN